jgi:hypothetical protein
MTERNFELVKGERYKTILSLNFIEAAFATNEIIKNEFEQRGFSSVIVTSDKSGKVRTVNGVWEHDTVTIPLDSHVLSMHKWE